MELDQAQRELDSFRTAWGPQITGVAGGKPWTELYDGLIAAHAVGAKKIRLTEAGARADLELMLDDCTVSVQHVRVLPDQQRKLNQTPGLIAYNPDDEVEWVLDALSEQVRKKAAKGYDPSFVLLVHIEMFNFASRRFEVLNRISFALSEGGRDFVELWATWQGKLLRHTPSRAAGR